MLMLILIVYAVLRALGGLTLPSHGTLSYLQSAGCLQIML